MLVVRASLNTLPIKMADIPEIKEPSFKVHIAPDDKNGFYDIELNAFNPIYIRDNLNLQYRFHPDIINIYDIDKNTECGVLYREDGQWMKIEACKDTPLSKRKACISVHYLDHEKIDINLHLKNLKRGDTDFLRFYCILNKKKYILSEVIEPQFPDKLLLITPDPIIKVGKTSDGSGPGLVE